MHLNLHSYKYKVQDVAWVLDGTNPRRGVVQTVEDSAYTILMDDNGNVESFTNPLMFPLKSHAEIYVNQFLVTPTPSISHSVTPTPTRTPRAVTPTPTPSSSHTIRPNLLSTNTNLWTCSLGESTVLSDSKLKLTVTLDSPVVHQMLTREVFGISAASTVFSSDDMVLDKNTDYSFSLTLEQGSCRFASVSVIMYDDNFDETIVINQYYHDSTKLDVVLNSGNNSGAYITVTLYDDPLYKTKAKIGSYYVIDNLSFKYLRKHITPPQPSSNLASYDQTVMNKSPALYWSFASLTDAVAGNALTLSAGSSLASDTYGGELSSTGTNSGATFQVPKTLSKSFTLEAWVNYDPSGFGSYLGILGTDAGGLAVSPSGTLEFFGNTDDIVGTGNLYASNDNHVVMTVDAEGAVLFYINGVASAGDSNCTETFNFTTIGNDFYNDFMVGKIGNVAIYNKVLTQSEVTENYTRGITNYRYSGNLILPSPTPTPTPSATPTKSFALYSSDGTTLVSAGLNSIGRIRNVSTDANAIYLSGYDMGSVNGVVGNCIKVNNNFTINKAVSDTDFMGLSGILSMTDGRELWYGSMGNIGGVNVFGLAPLNADGTLNQSTPSYQLTQVPNTVIKTADGKIYVGGGFQSVRGDTSKAKLFRLNNDFSLDTTYSIAVTGSVASLLQTADGKIYVSGNFTAIGGSTYTNFARLNSDGTVDTTFTNYGITSGGFIHQTADGKIYLGGSLGVVYNSTTYNNLLRFNSDGTWDTSWTNSLINGGNVYAMYELNGKILIVGYQMNLPNNGGTSNSFGAVLVLNSDGTVGTPLTNMSTTAQPDGWGLSSTGKLLISFEQSLPLPSPTPTPSVTPSPSV